MDWELAANLLLKYGPELADYIMKKIEAKGPVTPGEWAEVLALAKKTPQSQLGDALTRAGLSKDSPEAQALLALLPAT